MEQLTIIGFVFVILSLAGFWLAYLYGHKTKRFLWSEYIAIITFPLLFVIALAYFVDIKILFLFFVSSVAGFVLEYLLGFGYHKVFSQRLWTYGRFSVNGYTSLLCIPIWGIAGVIFWFLSKMVGL